MGIARLVPVAPRHTTVSETVVAEHSLKAVEWVDERILLECASSYLVSRPLHEVPAPHAHRASRARAVCGLQGPVRRLGEDAVEGKGLELAGCSQPGGGEGTNGGEPQNVLAYLFSDVGEVVELPPGAVDQHGRGPHLAVCWDNACCSGEGESRRLQEAGGVELLEPQWSRGALGEYEEVLLRKRHADRGQRSIDVILEGANLEEMRNDENVDQARDACGVIKSKAR